MTDLSAILIDGENVNMPALRTYLAEQAAKADATSDVLATGTIAALVDTRAFETQALLFADLVHADGVFAIVTKDPDPLLNGLYEKDGSSGAGSWDGPSDLFASAAEAAVQTDLQLARDYANNDTDVPITNAPVSTDRGAKYWSDKVGGSAVKIDVAANGVDFMVQAASATIGAASAVTETLNNRDSARDWSGYGILRNDEGSFNVIEALGDSWQVAAGVDPNATLHFLVRDGAIDGPILAVGSVEADDSGVYQNQPVALRDPDTLALLTDVADMPGNAGGVHAIVGFALKADGSMGQTTHPKANDLASRPPGQVSYFWPAGGDPRTDAASTFGTNDEMAFSTYISSELNDVREPTDDFAKQAVDKILGLEAEGRLFLRNWQSYLLTNAMGTASKFAIACMGDSWTQERSRYTQLLDDRLAAKFGETGMGYTAYAWTGGDGTPPYTIDPANQPVTSKGSEDVGTQAKFEGTWTVEHIGDPASSGPDLAHVICSDVGAYLERRLFSHSNFTGFDLIYRETVSGSFRYKINSGAWTTVVCTGTAGTPRKVTIAAVENDILTVECVSGTIELCGDVAVSSANGIQFLRLGSSGSKAAHWASADAAQQSAGWALLGDVKLWMVMLGTNDRAQAETPTQFASDMETIATRAAAAWPGSDGLIIMPPQTPADHVFNTIEYSREARAICKRLGLGFLDLQQAFGPVGTYADGDAYPMFPDDDLEHPDTDAGRYAIVSAISQYLFGEQV